MIIETPKKNIALYLKGSKNTHKICNRYECCLKTKSNKWVKIKDKHLLINKTIKPEDSWRQENENFTYHKYTSPLGNSIRYYWFHQLPFEQGYYYIPTDDVEMWKGKRKSKLVCVNKKNIMKNKLRKREKIQYY
jgi:hypothetical protein